MRFTALDQHMTQPKPRAVNDGRKNPQAEGLRVTELPVRRLRHMFADIDVSPRCLSHIAGDRRERSELALQQMPLVVFEDDDGVLHPAGYAAHAAALLAHANGDLMVPVVVSKRSLHQKPSIIDLAMDVNLRVSEAELAMEVNRAIQFLKISKREVTAIMVAEFTGLHPSKISRDFKELFS